MSEVPLAGLNEAGQPVLSRDRHLVTFVQPEDAADHASWLEYAIAYLQGQRRSAADPQPGEKLDRYARFHRKTASMFRDRNLEADNRLARLVGSAQWPAASFEDEITTTQAADLTGLSSEFWRLMGKARKIRARRDTRGVWLLSREDVIAEMRRRRGNGTSDGPEPGPAGAGGRSGGAGGSGHAGGPAGGSSAGAGRAA
jgi:hypothetical protein